jgi:branched-chain amino acid transport system permease protein
MTSRAIEQPATEVLATVGKRQRGRTIKFAPVKIGQWAMWSFFVFALIVSPLVFKSSLSLTILSQMGTLIIVCLSYNMLLGQSGMLSFGHAVYVGLGAFISIHVMNAVTHGAFWFPISLIPLIGGVAGAFFGVLFGYVTTKKSGTTFAMITLGIGELVAASSLMLPEFFGGEAGITTNRVIGQPVLGITFGPQLQVYYLIAIWTLLCTVLMYAFTLTPLGRMTNAVRDNPERAEFVGYNTQRVRYLVVIIAGFFAGIAGGLSAINFEIVSSENVSTVRSGAYLLFTFLGGVGFFFGPIIGAVIFVLSFVVLSEITKAWLLYLGIFFLLMVMYAPGGIASIIMMNLRVAKFGKFRRMRLPYVAVIAAGVPLFLGITSLIEMIYHYQLESANGTTTTLYGLAADTATPTPWIVAVIVVAIGCVAMTYASRFFKQAWSSAQTEIQALLERSVA